MDGYRAFVAIELPRALRARLMEHIATLRRELPDARASWSREDNLHLTLKFLGDVPASEIPKLSDAIARAVSGVKPFELSVSGCGVFPPKGRPNVLWIGISLSQNATTGNQYPRTTKDPSCSRHPTLDTRHPLFLLHSAIERECEHAGFAREPRPYHPHLTIARLRKTGCERRLGEAHQNLGFESEKFSVSDIVVFRSELLPQGSKHTAISRNALQE